MNAIWERDPTNNECTGDTCEDEPNDSDNERNKRERVLCTLCFRLLMINLWKFLYMLCISHALSMHVTTDTVT